ncbi:MAG: LexA-like protein [Bacteriophage sp.]|nr:MAG: LexA-like protein [Bacteriophage sp.]
MIEDKNREIGNRLKTARKAVGFSSARDAATALGINYRTYVGHENGNRGISRETLGLYAKRFHVTLDWLLTGKKSAIYSVPLMGYIGAGAEIMPDFEQVPPDGLEKIEIPFQIPDDMVAFSVKGDSMLPMYKDGYIIIVYRDQRKSIESFYGQEAAVRTSDGKRFIKTIMRGADGVNLFSWNAAPIENVKLEWIGEIFAVLPRQPSFLKKSLPNRL